MGSEEPELGPKALSLTLDAGEPRGPPCWVSGLTGARGWALAPSLGNRRKPSLVGRLGGSVC